MPVAIVTGAASGIGRASALALAKHGYAVALVGRTAATLQAVAAEIRVRGGTAECITADVSLHAQAEAMVATTHAKLGRIDLLLNNAGAAPAVTLAKMTIKQWHEVLDTNLSSVFYATRAVWPIMERQHAAGGKGGVIVNISSRASRDPFPGLGAYAAAKVGVNTLTLMTGREGESVGIRAVCIAPGAVNTPMFRNLVGDAFTPEIVMQPEDIAALVVEAAQGSLWYASGETIFVHRKPA